MQHVLAKSMELKTYSSPHQLCSTIESDGVSRSSGIMPERAVQNVCCSTFVYKKLELLPAVLQPAADDCQLTLLPTNKHQVTESEKEQAVVSRENWYHKCLSEILFDNSKDQLQAHRNTG